MLESLFLKNFQRHKRLSIDLDQITSICGQSDSGKSAIFRALRLVCLNRPDGIAFVRSGKAYSLIGLKVDGNKITRKKGKGKNEFSHSPQMASRDSSPSIAQLSNDAENVQDRDGSRRYQGKAANTETFKAFGNEVPQPIQKILQTGPLNFQGQHSNPFWFSLTPGQVAKELNGIVNLQVIDETLADVAGELRKARAEAEVSRSRLTDARERREELAWVKEADADLQTVESKGKYLDELDRKIASLASKIEEGKRLAKARDRALGEASALTHLLREGTRMWQAANQVDFMTEQLRILRKITENKCLLQKEQSETKEELKKESEARCPLCGRETK